MPEHIPPGVSRNRILIGVLRGSHDGFVETMVFNTALLRRRIRDPRLIVEIVRVGKKSRTDIAICYLESKADPSFVEKIKTKLNALTVDSLYAGTGKLSGGIDSSAMV